MAEEKGVNLKPDLTKYHSGTSGSGKKTKNCGDEVAKITDGFTVGELANVLAKMSGTTAKEWTEKYAKLNPGMQAMNLRNRIRGAVSKLDKAHAKDNSVVPGLKSLASVCEKPREAASRRAAKADADRKAREAKAAEKGKEKAA